MPSSSSLTLLSAFPKTEEGLRPFCVTPLCIQSPPRLQSGMEEAAEKTDPRSSSREKRGHATYAFSDCNIFPPVSMLNIKGGMVLDLHLEQVCNILELIMETREMLFLDSIFTFPGILK